MKKSNSFIFKFDYQIKDDLKFESMKNVFHFPEKEIKSNRLFNYFISEKYHRIPNKSIKSEYTLILSQKKKELNKISKLSSDNNFIYFNKSLNTNEKKLKNKTNISCINKNKNKENITNNIKRTDSDWSSYKYNSKVGLNAPLSYQVFSNNSSEEEQNNNVNALKENKNNNIYNNYSQINTSKKKKLKNNIKENDYFNKTNIKTKKNKKSKINKIKNNIRSFSYMSLNKLKKSFYSNNFHEYKLNLTNKNINNNINNKNDIKNKNNNNNLNNNINYKIFIINKSSDKPKIINRNKNDVFKNILVALNNKNNSFKNLKIEKINHYNYNNIYNNQNNSAIKKKTKIEDNLKIEESIINSDNSSSLDFNNINSPTSTKKNNLINNNFIVTRKFIKNKNKHFAINPEKSLSNTISGRTKDKTNRTIKKQNNIIINIKQNFKTNNIPSSINNIKQNITKNKKTNNNNKNNKNKNGFNYRDYIELKNLKEINLGEKIYKREIMLKQKKEKKLEVLRQRQDEDEMAEIRGVPKINEFSKKITKNNIPIYKRLNEIEKKKKLNREKIENIIISENEITENTINDKCAKNIFDEKNFNKWLLSNETWKLKKNLKLEKIKNIINKDKMEMEKYDFKPKIDKNSEKIFYNTHKLSKSPVIERLLKAKDHKDSIIKKIEEEEMLSFIPDINKDYEIKNEYYDFMDDDQAEIFNELKEKIENEEKKI